MCRSRYYYSVQKVLAISTDKAANPINLYGATKLCSDKLFVAANNLAGSHKTIFSIVRYGNVLASRGSVIPYFDSLIKKGHKRLPLTHLEMTRFSISLEEGVLFVMKAVKNMYGGEIFVPKLYSFKILDLISAMVGKGNFDVIGIRPGEKLHEVMIPKEESLNCIDLGDYYILQPMLTWWNNAEFKKNIGKVGKTVDNYFEYSSDSNTNWYKENDLKKILKRVL